MLVCKSFILFKLDAIDSVFVLIKPKLSEMSDVLFIFFKLDEILDVFVLINPELSEISDVFVFIFPELS